MYLYYFSPYCLYFRIQLAKCDHYCNNIDVWFVCTGGIRNIKTKLQFHMLYYMGSIDIVNSASWICLNCKENYLIYMLLNLDLIQQSWILFVCNKLHIQRLNGFDSTCIDTDCQLFFYLASRWNISRIAWLTVLFILSK